MQQLKTFLKTFIKSTTSAHYYKDVLKAPFTFSVKYFLFFNVLVGLITVAHILIPMSLFNIGTVLDKATSTLPADLQISVIDGRLSINRPLPYVVPFPADWRTNTQNEQQHLDNFIVFDSDANIHGIRDFYSYNTAILITETTIYAEQNQGRTQGVRAYPIPNNAKPFSISTPQVVQMKDAFLNSPWIKNKWYMGVIAIILFCLVIPLQMVARFLTALIYSALMYVIVSVLRKGTFNDRAFSYTNILQASLHVLTPIILAAYILSFLQFRALHGLLYFVVYVIAMIIALRGAAGVTTQVAVKTVPTAKKPLHPGKKAK